MIIKNLSRRKIRTLLTVIGIAIGVAAIVGLGALANGLQNGYTNVLNGSKADLVLSQPNTWDISYSSVEESVGKDLLAMPEVAEVSGMLQSWSQTEGEPFFFVFGYPEDSFVLKRFNVVQGAGLDSRAAHGAHGKPLLLGSAAAEVLKKSVGDTLRLQGSIFRIVGIYQTGNAFEDGGALLNLRDAQELAGKQRQVSLFYIRLKDLSLRPRLEARVQRQWKNLSLTTTDDLANKQTMADILQAYVWVVGGLAIVIGGVGMMNAQLMAVFERTREIGVLRAIGWSRWRILWMILGESVLVCLAGGAVGTAIGWLLVDRLGRLTTMMGGGAANIHPDLLFQAFLVVLLLGLVGGLYPAWNASRMQPVEALRYEGGSGGKVRRLPIRSMALQGLAQRLTRTALTLGAIGLTVGAIMALEGMIKGFAQSFNEAGFATDSEIMIRQNNISDTSLSAVDEKYGDKIAAMPEVANINGIAFTAVMMPEANTFFILLGHEPNGNAIRRYQIVEGKPLTSNRQMILGRFMADALNKDVGDTIDVGGTRFRVVGIYETGVGWEETGGVVTLRDAQSFMGRPRKVTMYAIKLHDSRQAEAVVNRINTQFPDLHAALSGEFASEMPDMQNSSAMLDGISMLAILIGGVAVLNTMLMSVFERTREIGVLRALGWRRSAILGLIMQEAFWTGILGAAAGIAIAFGLVGLMSLSPFISNYLTPQWSFEIFARAIMVAILLGVLGGLYPAWRATQLQPVEALRYE